MYVVTFTDGSTVEYANYESDDGGLRFKDTAGTVQRYAPFHSVEQITNEASSAEGGDGAAKYVTTFVDGATVPCASYELSNGGVKLYDETETVKTYAPFHSIQYIETKRASTD
mgnify:CR=1 FL=1